MFTSSNLLFTVKIKKHTEYRMCLLSVCVHLKLRTKLKMLEKKMYGKNWKSLSRTGKQKTKSGKKRPKQPEQSVTQSRYSRVPGSKRKSDTGGDRQREPGGVVRVWKSTGEFWEVEDGSDSHSVLSL